MGEAELLSTLIGGIYDASLDPSLWPAVLRKSAAFIGGWGGGLLSKDLSSKTGVIYFHDGSMDPHYIQLYFDKYVKLDPSNTAHYFGEIDEPVSTEDFVPLEEFYQTRFYKEWAEPQGLVDFVSTVLDKSPTSAAMYGVFRRKPQSVVDMDMRMRMRLVSPHVRRAVLISRVIEVKTAQADHFAATLDGLAASMFLVDSSGRIMHANRAGHDMLRDGSYLRAIGGKLSATEAEADRTLKAVFAAAGIDDSAVGTAGITVPLVTRPNDQLVGHVLPLSSGQRRDTGNAFKAAAALFVHKTSVGQPALPELIAKTFKLTPPELRVLLGIVEVGGAPEVAETLGVAESTVKTHLKRVYSKTGVNRQADLVKLVAGFTSPLAG